MGIANLTHNLLIGRVIHGNKEGRKLGFPTANLDPVKWYKNNEDVLIMPEGVYACVCYIPQLQTHKSRIHHSIKEKINERKLIQSVFSEKHDSTNFTPFAGLLHYGTRSTFNEDIVKLEVYLLDFNEEIYDLQMAVFVRDFIRHSEKFSEIESLVEQMNKDEIAARKLIL